MNKKRVVIGLILVLIVIILLILLLGDFTNDYRITITISEVDAYSPDRILNVYKNNELVNYDRIEYEDGIVLCRDGNNVVSYTELIGVEKLVVVIDEDERFIAKIVEK